LGCTPADEAEIVAARVAELQRKMKDAKDPAAELVEPPTRNQATTSSAWRHGVVFRTTRRLLPQEQQGDGGRDGGGFR
jgi:hypothetical protein